jgi:hypothetical protein
VAGPDRYATSAAVASDPLGEGLGRDVAWVAAGGDFSDGLVAGPAAARDGARLGAAAALHPTEPRAARLLA